MRIPDKIRIAGIDYTITYGSNLILDGRQVVGVINYNESAITIDKSVQSDQQALQTMWHELVHAILHHYNVGDLQDDEDIVDKIASGIYMILSDNPNMISNDN